MQTVEQPVQGLGQDGEPAVIFEQLQTRRQRLEHFFFLRADKQRGRDTAAGAWCNRLDRRYHGCAVAAVCQGARHVHAVKRNGAAHALGQYPSAGKVMLHHGDIAIASLLFIFRIFLFDVGKLHLLVFLGLGIDRRAGEGGVERRLARRFVAIT